MTSESKEKFLSKHYEVLKATKDELQDSLKSLRIILRRNHKDINEQMKHIIEKHYGQKKHENG